MMMDAISLMDMGSLIRLVARMPRLYIFLSHNIRFGFCSRTVDVSVFVL